VRLPVRTKFPLDVHFAAAIRTSSYCDLAAKTALSIKFEQNSNDDGREVASLNPLLQS